MRLLGRCPRCEAEDTLVVTRGYEPKESIVSCESCRMNETTGDGFRSLWDFCRAEEVRGNKLTMVEIRNEGLSVRVWSPQPDDIPHARLIAQVLNTALIVRFGLQICFATEGGVQGFLRDGPVELRNLYQEFGLGEYEYHRSQASRRVLRWYEKLVRTLFEEDLRLGRHRYGRGAILKLSHDPKDATNAVVLLWVALARVSGKKFATAVFRELEDLRGIAHLAGLTDEDIARVFVPPPELKEWFEAR